MVAASDVLYEQPQAALVAAVLAARLVAGRAGPGLAIPGRRTAPTLFDECAARGLAARLRRARAHDRRRRAPDGLDVRNSPSLAADAAFGDRRGIARPI